MKRISQFTDSDGCVHSLWEESNPAYMQIQLKGPNGQPMTGYSGQRDRVLAMWDQMPEYDLPNGQQE